MQLDEWQGWKILADDALAALNEAENQFGWLRSDNDFNTNDYVNMHLTEIELLVDQIRVQWKYAKLARTNR